VATWEFFVQAVEFARRHDLLLCHDAAYSQVTFDGYLAPSILEIPGAKDVAVEFNTLSKSHNMAGWRLGAVVGNAQAVTAVCTVKTNADSGHFLPIHVAAIQAMGLEQSWIDQRNEVYRQRRDLVVNALHKAGLEAKLPQASLYVWCPVPQGWKSIDFVDRLLEDAHVSLTPGTFFGTNGEGFVRISVTEPLEVLDEAMQRIADMLGKIG
jgi:LL-diaminopimelate aminotransferase